MRARERRISRREREWITDDGVANVANARWPGAGEIINYQSSRAPIIRPYGHARLSPLSHCVARSALITAKNQRSPCEYAFQRFCLCCAIKCVFNTVSISEIVPDGV